MFKNMMGGLGGLGDMASMMARAQEMQTKLGELQTKLAEIEVEGAAGAGMVRAIVTAKGAMKTIEIDPSLMAPEEREVLQDLIAAAVADAQAKASERAQDEMRRFGEEFGLPPGMLGGGPFGAPGA